MPKLPGMRFPIYVYMITLSGNKTEMSVLVNILLHVVNSNYLVLLLLVTVQMHLKRYRKCTTSITTLKKFELEAPNLKLPMDQYPFHNGPCHRPHQRHVPTNGIFQLLFGFSANRKQRCTARKKKRKKTLWASSPSCHMFLRGRRTHVHPNII